MGNTPTSTLEEMCELIVDCPHFTPEWTESGFVVIRNQNIRDGRLDLSQPSFTHRDDFERRIKRAKPRAGDIIFTREAPMGEVCMVPKGLECCVGQRQVLLRPKISIDGRYLFFALRSEYVRHQIFWNEGTGSTVSNVRIPVLKALKLPRLGQAETSIAESLGALDDKIDLNRRMNGTLEAMARAIFKDWFVDFGPVRAKAEGREPYLVPEIWDLFPDALDDDDKPVGWEEQSLAAFFSIIGGGTPKTSVDDYWGGDIPWFSVVDTPPTGSLFVLDTEKSITKRGLEESSARLVPAGTTIISARGTVGNLAVAARDMTFNQSCYGLRGNGVVGDCFVFLAAKQMVARLQSMAHGSVFSTITRQTFKALSLPMPTESILQGFEAVTAPLFTKVKENVALNSTLTQTRDLLLPKLMSGEIRVAGAVKAVDKALSGEVIDFDKERQVPSRPKRRATPEFQDAILVSALVRALSSPHHPLGNFRLQKMAYFAHRRAEHDVLERFKKHAAGPYDPQMEYAGGISVAKRNGYIQKGKVDKERGYLPGKYIAKIDAYLPRYDFADAVSWAVEKFRYKKNPELELLATVDYAALSLRIESTLPTPEAVLNFIAADSKWQPKTKRDLFSRENIARAMDELAILLPEQDGAP